MDVVFFRSPSAHLVVAGENQEAIRGIKSRFEGDKLVIEQEGVSFSGGGGPIFMYLAPATFLSVAQSMSVDAEVAGAGDVDASELVATSAKLSVAASGDIKFKK